jgi:ElaB/YqjD/DUF883 family membrane-anchored ribosome-binding protein
MVDHVEVIKKQMDDTRTSLADKIEALETQVTDTVKEATHDVTDTVKTVKETVEDVTDSVKEAVGDVTQSVSDTVEEVTHNVASFFDVTGHVRRHPWAGLGASVAAGFLVGRILPRGRSAAAEAFHEAPSLSAYAANAPDYNRAGFFNNPAPAPVATAPAAAEESRPKGWLWEQLEHFKGLAVGAVMGMVRDLAVRNLPGQIGEKVAEEVNNLTTRLGGEKFTEPVLPQEPSSGRSNPDHNGKQTFTGSGV